MPLKTHTVPSGYIPNAYPTCTVEATTRIDIVPTDHNGIDSAIDAITAPAAKRIPLQAHTIPSCYMVGAYTACHYEGAAHINVVSADCYCINAITHAITGLAAKRIPLAADAIPSCYIVGGHPSCFSKV